MIETNKSFIILAILSLLYSCKLEEIPDATPTDNDKQPIACFTIDNLPDECIADCEVSFSSSCSINATSYLWDFGDGENSEVANPTHEYSSPGEYTVKLVATNGSAENDTTNVVRIEVLKSLVASFEIPTERIYNKGCSVVFTNTSIGGKSFDWNFGNLFQLTEENPEVIFKKSGNFEVTLTVSDGSNTDEMVQPFEVYDLQKIERSYSDYSNGTGVVLDEEGTGFVILTNSSLNSNEIILKKIDSNGDNIWIRSFGGKSGDWANNLIATGDGYLITGKTKNIEAEKADDVYLIKTDLNGNVVWEHKYGGPKDEEGYSSVKTDAGYFVTGYTKGFQSQNGMPSVYLLKVTLDGMKQWDKSFGGERWDEGTDIISVEDGFVISGFTRSFPADENSYFFYLLKVDDNGNKQWEKTFGGVENDIANSLISTNDGFVILGRTNSFGAGESSDIYLVKTDINGEKEWAKTIGGIQYENAYDIILINDGYLIVGETNKKMYLVHTDLNGEKDWERTFSYNGYDGKATSVLETNDCGIAILGSIDNGDRMYFIKKDSHGD